MRCVSSDDSGVAVGKHDRETVRGNALIPLFSATVSDLLAMCTVHVTYVYVDGSPRHGKEAQA